MDQTTEEQGGPIWKRHRWDLLLLAILVLTAGLAAWDGLQRVRPELSESRLGDNVWFEGDTYRVFTNMTERRGMQGRSPVHPIFSLLTQLPVRLLEAVGAPKLMAVRLVLALLAALWVGALFSVLRALELRRFDSLLFTLLGATSSAAFFWCTTPETYSFGSLTILLALLLTALAARREIRPIWWVLAGAGTLGITVTNWMVALLGAFTALPWKRAAKVVGGTVLLVTVLWGLQATMIHGTSYFIGSKLAKESEFLLREGSGGPLAISRCFFFHSEVMPAWQVKEHGRKAEFPYLTLQQSPLASGGRAGLLATALWTMLLVFGFVSLFRARGNVRFRWVLGLALAGQLVLHLLYGPETFLYTLNFVALLIPLVALTTLTPFRRQALVLGLLLLLTGTWNNVRQWSRAVTYLDHYPDPSRMVPREEDGAKRHAALPGLTPLNGFRQHSGRT